MESLQSAAPASHPLQRVMSSASAASASGGGGGAAVAALRAQLTRAEQQAAEDKVSFCDALGLI